MAENFETERQRVYEKFASIQQADKTQHDLFGLMLFRFQYKYNAIYRNFCQQIGKTPDQIGSFADIPYLPISAFRHHQVLTGDAIPMDVFTSSGTTGGNISRHLVCDINHYLSNTEQIWTMYYAPVEQYCFLCLLPGYLERQGSSLLRMAQHFTQKSGYAESDFYLRNHEDLYRTLLHCKEKDIPTVLLGVSYALLDFTDKYTMDFPSLIVMETGGMKGQRKEMVKAELHLILRNAFGVPKIHSEYGMTELLSQAYSKGDNVFCPNDRLTVTTRQIHDPLSTEKIGKTGLICVCDFANIDSCAFIQTEDIGIVYDYGSFEILGRADIADIRGCNLLLEDIGIF
jgi:hypothetical protein